MLGVELARDAGVREKDRGEDAGTGPYREPRGPPRKPIGEHTEPEERVGEERDGKEIESVVERSRREQHADQTADGEDDDEQRRELGTPGIARAPPA